MTAVLLPLGVALLATGFLFMAYGAAQSRHLRPPKGDE